MTMRSGILAATALTIALSSPALAQMQGQEFVEKAAAGGMFEVQSSQIALDKTESAGIRDFAQEMVNDHSKANEKLKSVAQQEGLSVPSELPQDMQAKIEELGKAGDNFEQTYLQMQVNGHEKDISLFEDCAQNCSSEALKTFASETLPTLKEHYQDVTALAKEVGNATN